MKQFKIEIKWAVVFMIASIVWTVIEKMAGFHDIRIHQQVMFSALFAIPAIAIYVLMLREKKQKYFNGNMSWQQGFISGIFLAVFVAVLSIVAQFISYTFISPEFFPNMIKYTVNSHRMTEEVAQANFNLQSAVKRGVFDALSYGVLTSAIVALFVKTKTPN